MAKRYKIVIDENQRRLIINAIKEMINTNHLCASESGLIKQLKYIPKSENEHPGITHVLSH